MNTIYLRQACNNDVGSIMNIIAEAKLLLKKDGSPQWQDGHPDKKQILMDIEDGIGQVLIVNGKLAGYAALSTIPEKNYQNIHNGSWNNNDKYCTLHRIAISSGFRGLHLSKIILSILISKGMDKGYYNFRVDTHAKNLIMQHVLQSYGFIKQGIVEVEDNIDSSRIAYELNLK